MVWYTFLCFFATYIAIFWVFVLDVLRYFSEFLLNVDWVFPQKVPKSSSPYKDWMIIPNIFPKNIGNARNILTGKGKTVYYCLLFTFTSCFYTRRGRFLREIKSKLFTIAFCLRLRVAFTREGGSFLREIKALQCTSPQNTSHIREY